MLPAAYRSWKLVHRSKINFFRSACTQSITAKRTLQNCHQPVQFIGNQTAPHCKVHPRFSPRKKLFWDEQKKVFHSWGVYLCRGKCIESNAKKDKTAGLDSHPADEKWLYLWKNFFQQYHSRKSNKSFINFRARPGLEPTNHGRKNQW